MAGEDQGTRALSMQLWGSHHLHWVKTSQCSCLGVTHTSISILFTVVCKEAQETHWFSRVNPGVELYVSLLIKPEGGGVDVIHTTLTL